MKFKCRLCSHIFYSNTVYSTRCPLCKRTHVVRQDEPIPRTSDPEPTRHSADSTIVAPVFDAPSLPSDSSSDSFSGGGGDSGGGGSSGDW